MTIGGSREGKEEVAMRDLEIAGRKHNSRKLLPAGGIAQHDPISSFSREAGNANFYSCFIKYP
jgi:hypothetical protein